MTPVGQAARKQWAFFVVVFLLLALVPLIMTSGPERSLAMRFMIVALLGVFWNISSGISGQFSFGHAAYFGIGAYVTAFLSIDLQWSPWVAGLMGGIASALGGALIGYLTFRYKLKDAYFALTTFAIAELLRLIVVRFEPLRAGVGYRVPLVDEPGWSAMQFGPADIQYFIIAFVLLAGAVAFTIFALQGRYGFRIVAVREDEAAAAAIGLNPLTYKTAALVVSAFGTGLCGALYLNYQLFIDPDLAFGPSISIQAILCAVIGGVGTIWGPVFGAAVLIAISDLTASLTRDPPAFLSFLDGRSGLDLVIYGLVLIVTLMLVPHGVYGSFLSRRSK